MWDNVAVSALYPALANSQPYSNEHTSVKGGLIARSSHTHSLYQENNTDVYYKLEEATRDTSYVESIKTFQYRKDSCSAFLSLLGQCTGADKCECKIKIVTSFIHAQVEERCKLCFREVFNCIKILLCLCRYAPSTCPINSPTSNLA